MSRHRARAIGVLLIVAIAACSNHPQAADPQCAALDAQGGDRCSPIGARCDNPMGPLYVCVCSDAGWYCSIGSMTTDQ